MSQTHNDKEEVYRKLTETGATTIPAKFRGDESGYVIYDKGDHLVLVPANAQYKEEGDN